MLDVEKLQIGHLHEKECDCKIVRRTTSDRTVEVGFSHRHMFYAVYVIHAGGGSHVIDFEEYELKPGRFFFVRPAQVHFLCGDADLEYSALQFSEEFLLQYIQLNGGLFEDIAASSDVDSDAMARLDVLFRQIEGETDSGHYDSATIVSALVNTLLLELWRISSHNVSLPFMPDILRRYRNCVDRHFTDLRQVNGYASMLGVTPGHLNVLTRKYMGKTALSVICERIVLEIKRRLLQTDDDISEIAYQLGFNELSYFSRFFRQNTGMTPAAFRTMVREMYQK